MIFAILICTSGESLAPSPNNREARFFRLAEVHANEIRAEEVGASPASLRNEISFLRFVAGALIRGQTLLARGVARCLKFTRRTSPRAQSDSISTALFPSKAAGKRVDCSRGRGFNAARCLRRPDYGFKASRFRRQAIRASGAPRSFIFSRRETPVIGTRTSRRETLLL